MRNARRLNGRVEVTQEVIELIYTAVALGYSKRRIARELGYSKGYVVDLILTGKMKTIKLRSYKKLQKLVEGE